MKAVLIEFHSWSGIAFAAEKKIRVIRLGFFTAIFSRETIIKKIDDLKRRPVEGKSINVREKEK